MLGEILCDFVTNSSGHPVYDQIWEKITGCQNVNKMTKMSSFDNLIAYSTESTWQPVGLALRM
jgi:hypothetical protein